MVTRPTNFACRSQQTVYTLIHIPSHPISPPSSIPGGTPSLPPTPRTEPLNIKAEAEHSRGFLWTLLIFLLCNLVNPMLSSSFPMVRRGSQSPSELGTLMRNTLLDAIGHLRPGTAVFLTPVLVLSSTQIPAPCPTGFCKSGRLVVVR